MKLISTIFFGLITGIALSQASVKVEVSADTIAVGQQVQVTYTVENGDGDFNLPDMNDLPVISGPNSSSSFLYQNGKMTSSQSYSFWLQPTGAGKLTIPGASYGTGNEKLTIDPVEIVVSDTLEDIMLSKPQTTSTPAKPAREKRKI